MDEKVLLSVENLKKYYNIRLKDRKKVKLKAVNNVNFNIYKGETFGVVGESGSGKSTLGKTILRLHDITGGKIIFKNKDITSVRGKDLKQFRKEGQMIFQDPSSCLNPRKKVIDILNEPYEIHKIYSSKERTERIDYLCEKVGISKQYYNRYPYEMSGGQKQRIGIARALSLQPEFIVCDEAVSALDVSIQSQVINLLQDLQDEFKLTYMFISHNLNVVKHICDRIAVMYLGEIMELSSSDNIYEKAAHPYTKALISAIPSIDEEERERIVLKGDLPSPTDPPKGCVFSTRCPKVHEKCKEKPILKKIEDEHYVACHLFEEKES